MHLTCASMLCCNLHGQHSYCDYQQNMQTNVKFRKLTNAASPVGAPPSLQLNAANLDMLLLVAASG